MPCRMRNLTMLFAIAASSAGCTLFPKAPIAVDSFCKLYEPVIRTKADGIITATREVKERILTNDLQSDTCPKKGA